MCGRFTLFSADFLALLQTMNVKVIGKDTFTPHFNIAPGQQHWMLFKQQNALYATQAQWGISPDWMKPGQLLFNAKIETAMEKPTFKKAYSLHRCVIPINGFYEWTKDEEIKQPYFFYRMNEEVFFLAGIYFVYGEVKKFVLMTTRANTWMQSYHHRMPILLTKKNYMDWLSTKAIMEREDFEHVSTLLEQRKVSTKVNTGRIDDASCIDPI
ncbi:MAG: SOS response-associated peptidase [Deltaproteobacteria bacterium]|nr:SOS response-associated peptidase [Deltaproteobacteria bacterium]